MVNDRIGPYKLIREIADGRLGPVFEAIDLTRRKHVVIQSLRPEAAKRPEIVSRLYSEAKTLALLNHPNIARIFGFVRRDDRLYLVMEFVEGESLRTILQKKQRLDPAVALALAHQLFSALAFGHELGVVHGDLKPSNVMVSNFGRIKVLDFATTTILKNSDPANPGIVGYRAPEQIRHEPVDVRTDTFLLGALVYECITGRAPFQRDAQAAAGALESTPLLPSLVVPDCPHRLDAFMLRALAPSPADRFQSITEMSQALGAPFEAKKTARRGRLWLSPRRKGPVIDGAIPRPGFRSLAAAIADKSAPAGWADAMAGAMRRIKVTGPLHWPQSCADKVRIWTRRVASSRKRFSNNAYRATMNASNIAKEMIRQEAARMRRVACERFAVVRPLAWAKSNAGRLRDRTRGLRAATVRGARSFGSVTKNVSSLSRGGWQSYVAINLVLAAVLIEIFIFGDAHTLSRHKDDALAALSHNGGAESLLEQLDQLDPPLVAPAASAPETKEPPKAVKRRNGAPKTPAPPTNPEPLHNEARPSRRIVTYRAEWHDFPKTVLPEQKPVAPAPPKRNLENNSAKNQLDVKWEN